MQENERNRILMMLSEGKITVEEASQLLAAIEPAEKTEAVALKDSRGRKGKKLRVVVDNSDSQKEKKDRVNISFPLSLIKTFGPLILKNLPKDAKAQMDESGIDITQLLADINNIADNGLDEDIVNIDTAEGEKVRIYIE